MYSQSIRIIFTTRYFSTFVKIGEVEILLLNNLVKVYN